MISDAGDGGGRPLPPKTHSGAAVVHDLCEDEEGEWRRWMPKVGDVVLVELAEDGIWPGKVSGRARLVPQGTDTSG